MLYLKRIHLFSPACSQKHHDGMEEFKHFPDCCFWKILELMRLCYYLIISGKSCSVMSDSLQPHGLYNPWNSPGQNTGVGSLSLLQRIFPTQELNQGLLHCRWILYQLSYEGNPLIISTHILMTINLLPLAVESCLRCSWDKRHCIWHILINKVAHWIKNLPAVQKTQVQSLGWENPLEKEMTTHSSILAWKMLWTEEP